MRSRLKLGIALGLIVLGSLFAATLALGSGHALIWDDGKAVQPGSLDDGKDLLPQTKISLSQAITAARGARSGALGQVDLAQSGARVVYVVDVGDREVTVDATHGTVTSVDPQE